MRPRRLAVAPAAATMLFLLVSFSLSAGTCDDDGSVPLASFAHSTNEAFIASISPRRRFVPSLTPAAVDANSAVRPIDVAGGRYFTYVTDNGWNNQLLNLLAAVDMARLLNRTLIVPPFSWTRRRGEAKCSVGRLVALRRLAAVVPLIAEDEHGTVAASLASASHSTIQGEGQPHRKRRMPRWEAEGWVRAQGANDAAVLRVTCCLFCAPPATNPRPSDERDRTRTHAAHAAPPAPRASRPLLPTSPPDLSSRPLLPRPILPTPPRRDVATVGRGRAGDTVALRVPPVTRGGRA